MARRRGGESVEATKAVAVAATSEADRRIALLRIISRTDPALAAKVAQGKISVSRAYKIATGEAPPRKRKQSAGTTRQRVEVAARLMNVSSRSIWKALAVRRLAPQLGEQIMAGTLSLDAAYRIAAGTPARPDPFDRLVRHFRAAPRDVQWEFVTRIVLETLQIIREVESIEEEDCTPA